MLTNTNSTLYCIPGTMCDERLWQDVWRHLKEIAPQLHCVHIEIPKHNNYQLLLDEIDQQIPDGATTLGFSLGGYIASALTAARPEKIAQLLVVSNQPTALPDTEIKHRRRTINWIEQHGYQGISTQRMQDLLHPIAHNNIDISNTIKAMDKSLGEQTLLQQLRVSSIRENLLLKFAKLNTPIHFCIGEADSLVDINMLKSQIRDCKHIDLNIVKNCGHMLPLEQPLYLAKFIFNKLYNKAI